MRVIVVGKEFDASSLVSSRSITQVARGRQGVRWITKKPFDLAIIKSELPDLNGFQVCKLLRKAGCTLPILMITPHRETSARVRGLRMGADDCLDESFSRDEILARIHALVRRSDWDHRRFQFGPNLVDLNSGRVFRAGRRVHISEREFAVLRYLIERQGAVVSRDQLLVDVWGYNVAPRTRTVDMHIASLRQKLEKNPQNPEWILTVHSQGYRLHNPRLGS